MARICEGKSWISDDPLGIGGLLSGAYRMAQLIPVGSFVQPVLLDTVLEDCLTGLDYFARGNPLRLPAKYRLAFRELGLAIGLQALERLERFIEQHTGVLKQTLRLRSLLKGLKRYAPLGEAINAFWLDSKNRESATWKQHRNINMVMLATSLAPDGYLSLNCVVGVRGNI
jgi:hypothetical protein